MIYKVPTMTKNAAARTGLFVCLLWLLSAATTNAQYVLYGSSSGINSPLYVIDPATGQSTLIGYMGTGIGAMAFNRATGILYGVTAPGFVPPSGTTRQLVRIDTRTAVVSVIGPLG